MPKSSLFPVAFLVFTLSCMGPANEKQVPQKASASPTPSEQELRLRTQEQLLRGENYHDGSSILESVGTIESVPALLKVLEDNPPIRDGANICTAGHAIDALKKITGANPGYTYKEWRSWWDKYQKNQLNSNRRSNTRAQ